jgi:hypothetical protein
VLGTIALTMWEEGGSYGAISALGIVQIVPLLVIVALLRILERRAINRYNSNGAEDEANDAKVTIDVAALAEKTGAARR